MAIVVPYPNMDFTPLDVLTATEMDQIVSNYEYIADQLPAGNKYCLARIVERVSNVTGNFGLDTIVHQDGGFTLNTSGRVVVPEAGYYLISGAISGQFAAGKGWIRIRNQNSVSLSMAIDRSNSVTVYKGIYVPACVARCEAGDSIAFHASDEILQLNGGMDSSGNSSVLNIVQLKAD